MASLSESVPTATREEASKGVMEERLCKVAPDRDLNSQSCKPSLGANAHRDLAWSTLYLLHHTRDLP